MSLKPPRKRSAEYKLKKKFYDQTRAKSRVNIGRAIQRWRDFRDWKGLKTDEDVALFLLDSYLRTNLESRPQHLSLQRSSSTETCDSLPFEYQIMMNSPNEAERETLAASFAQSSNSGKELWIDQKPQSEAEWTTATQSENRDLHTAQEEEEEEEEFSTSLSVGDGRYLVDLGSSSEFVVDEECILQLLKSCRKCNRQCTVRKRVKGLKLVVNAACCFCDSRFKWTNLPDDDDDIDDGDFQINGKDAAPGQNTAMSPSSSTS